MRALITVIPDHRSYPVQLLPARELPGPLGNRGLPGRRAPRAHPA